MPTRIPRVIAGLVPICCVAVHLLTADVSAGQQPIRNRKELRQALAAAKTTDDHLRLAGYYQRKAETLRAKGEYQEQLVQYYLRHPLVTKYPTLVDRSRQLAGYYRLAAQKALASAGEHQRRAVELAPSREGSTPR